MDHVITRLVKLESLSSKSSVYDPIPLSVPTQHTTPPSPCTLHVSLCVKLYAPLCAALLTPAPSKPSMRCFLPLFGGVGSLTVVGILSVEIV